MELRFIKIDNTIRLQYRDGFKEVDGDITIECVWVDVPFYNHKTQQTEPYFNLSELIRNEYNRL